MVVPGRILCVALAGAFLTSCQPSRYQILASGQGSDILFTVSDRDRDNALGARADRLTVRGADAVVWAIEVDHACRSDAPARPFPLTYGRTPDCYRELTAAQPLQPDQLYLVTGDSSRDGDGYFAAGRSVINFQGREVTDRMRGWRDLSERP